MRHATTCTTMFCVIFLVSSAVVDAQPPVFEFKPKDSATDVFVTWAPLSCTLKAVSGVANDLEVVLTNDSPNPVNAGSVRFADTNLQQGQTATETTLALTIPADGTPVEFFVAGEFPNASSEPGDAKILVRLGSATGEVLGTLSSTVRVRKNAKSLTSAEKRRFLEALADVVTSLETDYEHFQDMHSVGDTIGYLQAHRQPGFPAWHRAMLLHLERELQKFDPSVTLPYWDWHDLNSAQAIFNADFLGRTVTSLNDPTGLPRGSVVFGHPPGMITPANPQNPLRNVWPFESELTRETTARFRTSTPPTNVLLPYDDIVLPEDYVDFQFGSIDNLGNSTGFNFERFGHDGAHGWVGGSDGLISDPKSAVKDPVFFLLHTNVDREWAKWQRQHDRFDVFNPDVAIARSVYYPDGDYFHNTANVRKGHFAKDTMWPWNRLSGEADPPTPNDQNDVRPSWAAAKAMPVSNGLGPTAEPTVGQVVDYLGKNELSNQMGFCYDSEPFE